VEENGNIFLKILSRIDSIKMAGLVVEIKNPNAPKGPYCSATRFCSSLLKHTLRTKMRPALLYLYVI
jgi:hypothetical protein